MKFKSKVKDYRLTVKAKAAMNEEIDEAVLDGFSRVYLRGFLKPKTIKRGVVEYSGPAAISLLERMGKPISKHDFLFIIEQIIAAVQVLEKNSLSTANIVSDIRNVYINETTKEIQFIYLPVRGNSESTAMALIDAVLYSAVPAQDADSQLIMNFTYFLKGLGGFDADKIERSIQQEDSSVVDTIKRSRYDGTTATTADSYKAIDLTEYVGGDFCADTGFDLVYPDEDEGAYLISEAFGNTATDRLDEEYMGEATGLLNEEYDGEATGLLNEEYDSEATGLLDEEEYAGAVTLFDADTADTPDNNNDNNIKNLFLEEYAEEATGLLTEDDEEATGLLNEDSDFGEPDEDATGLLADDSMSATGRLEEDDDPPSALAEDGWQDNYHNDVLPVGYPVLIRISTGERISVNKPVFRIGKERSYVDCFIANNSAVSRSHADIVTRGTGYYVVDLNSKNHTFVNDLMVPVNQETKLRDGDRLVLGNEVFIFTITDEAPLNNICAVCGRELQEHAKFCIFCGNRA